MVKVDRTPTALSLFPGSAARGRRGSVPQGAALADDDRGVDEREMGQRLREVAEQTAGARVVLLGEQADVVAQIEQPLEQLARLVELALQREYVREPERAGQKDALTGRQSVDGTVLLVQIAQDESVDGQLAPDRLDSRDEALVGRR